MLVIYLRGLDCLTWTSFTLSFFSVTCPRGPPRAGCKFVRDSGPADPFTGTRHHSSEDSRHLTWLSSSEPNGRTPLPMLWLKAILLNLGIVSLLSNGVPLIICSPQYLGLLPLVLQKRGALGSPEFSLKLNSSDDYKITSFFLVGLSEHFEEILMWTSWPGKSMDVEYLYPWNLCCGSLY